MNEFKRDWKLVSQSIGKAVGYLVTTLGVPTYSYLPIVYYYQGRDREGLKSKGFADSMG